jgi:preprotein translocase subunit SecD
VAVVGADEGKNFIEIEKIASLLALRIILFLMMMLFARCMYVIFHVAHTQNALNNKF